MFTASIEDAICSVVFFLEVKTTMKPLLQPDRIFTIAHPLPGVPEMSVGNDTYGVTGIPSTVGRRGVVQRVGLAVSTQIVYPGSGREDT